MTRYVVCAVMPETVAEPEVLQDVAVLSPKLIDGAARFVRMQALFTSGLDQMIETRVVLSSIRFGVAVAVSGPAPVQEPEPLLTETAGQVLQLVLEPLTRMTYDPAVAPEDQLRTCVALEPYDPLWESSQVYAPLAPFAGLALYVTEPGSVDTLEGETEQETAGAGLQAPAFVPAIWYVEQSDAVAVQVEVLQVEAAQDVSAVQDGGDAGGALHSDALHWSPPSEGHWSTAAGALAVQLPPLYDPELDTPQAFVAEQKQPSRVGSSAQVGTRQSGKTPI